MKRSILYLSFLMMMLAGSAFGQTMTAKVISSEEFKLSQAAEGAGIDGTLVLHVKVDEKGTVKSAEVVAGPAWPCGTDPKKELGDVKDAVRQSVMNSKFSPEIADGKPRASDLRIKFTLGQAYKRMLEKRKADESRENIRAIFGGVLNGKATSLPKPAYPQAARDVRAGGAVPVEVLVDEQGKVTRAGATSGHPALQAAARKAACSAKFAPTLLEGQPVKVSGVITYNFFPAPY